MSKRLLPRLLGTVAALTLVAAGCGGSSSSGTGNVTVKTTSLKTAQFVKEANRLCMREIRTVGDVINKALSTGTSVKPVEAAVLPVAERLLGDLQALGAPKNEKAEFEAFLTAFRGDIERARQRPSASMEAFAALFKGSGDLARSVKLESCAFG